MEYRKGYTIKPKEISSTGIVTFTDGTNDVMANQITCEAYGYTYNQESATCSAFKYNVNINKNIKTSTNIIKGSRNSLERATDNALILGENNTTKGNNRNILISGEKNEIETSINNSSIIGGGLGISSNQGEVVISGGGFNELLGMAQTSFVQQSNNTTDETETALLTQYLPTTYIEKVANSVIGFEANVIGVNTGVGVGSAGEYGYVQITGAVKFTNGLASTYYQTETAIVTSGHSGLSLSAEMKDVTATSFGVAVTGIAETFIQWTASIKLWRNNIQQTI
jgi:hypothetical protein